MELMQMGKALKHLTTYYTLKPLLLKTVNVKRVKKSHLQPRKKKSVQCFSRI